MHKYPSTSDKNRQKDLSSPRAHTCQRISLCNSACPPHVCSWIHEPNRCILCLFSLQAEEEKPPEGVVPKAPVPTEVPAAVGIDRKRNTSVISKKSTGVESTQLSRVGSVHDPVLRKQESAVSQGSQGTGTHPHSVFTSAREKSQHCGGNFGGCFLNDMYQ